MAIICKFIFLVRGNERKKKNVHFPFFAKAKRQFQITCKTANNKETEKNEMVMMTLLLCGGMHDFKKNLIYFEREMV